MTLADMTELGFYELLGCGPGDDKLTISRRFKTLAKIYHPDKGGGAEDFKYHRMVYEELNDDEQRAQDDREGKGPLFMQSFNEQEPQEHAHVWTQEQEQSTSWPESDWTECLDPPWPGR